MRFVLRPGSAVGRRLLPLLALLLAASPALAQYGEAKGNLYGQTVDEQGGVVPGVSVVLSGQGATQTRVTDEKGQFRFLNLAPGTYTVTMSLQGFATVVRQNVDIDVGKNTELVIPMKLSSVAETLTVSEEAPLLDTRKVQTGAILSPDEMKQIPTARDPWVILQSMPGVEIDRVNVAGSESGQQSNYMSKGSTAGSFTMDGVTLTDVTAPGASNIYYDWDSFQEIQVITGGSDVTIQGPGPHLNMVTKHGTNDVHGSARVFVVDHSFEAHNTPDELQSQIAQGGGLGSGNTIDSIQDYGGELGGPIWKDHMWLWGSYGRDQINLVTVGNVSDKTTLENFNAKYNWQIIPSNAFSIWYQRSNKLKFGRNAGPSFPQETTEDQTTPQNTWKFEDSQVFSSNVFASISYSGQNGTFTLTPEGGTATQRFLDANGINHNSYYFFQQTEPQRQVKADTSIFLNTGALGHELKVGFQYLNASAHSSTSWPGNGSNGLAEQTYGDLLDCAGPCAVVTRASSKNIGIKFWSAYFADTLTLDRFTGIVGVRWDRQYGQNEKSSIPANATFPDILPAVNYPGADRQFTWDNWSPRVGITYALGQNRTTLLKASYARFVEALSTPIVGLSNPLAGVAYAYYAWNDANGDNLVQPGEVDTSNLIRSANYDPSNPASIGSSPNGISSKLKAPTTDEFVGGAEHEFTPGFVAGLTYTYRKYKNFLYAAPYYSSDGRILNSSDYVPSDVLTGFTPSGQPYSVPTYVINPDIINAEGGPPGGTFTYNRPNYSQNYSGIDLTLTKRLSNRWMARASFTYQINKQQVGSGACADPNNVVIASRPFTPQSLSSATTCRNDDYVTVQSQGSGSKDSVFLNSKWSFNANAMYQLPWDFNIAGNLFGRQGYPIVWYYLQSASDGVTRQIALQPVNAVRYNTVLNLDLRLEKVIAIGQVATATVSADLFNVLNGNTVLQRYNQTNLGSNTGFIKEIQSPRIWRFGVRFAF
jgi:hypothetical protein